MKPLCFRASLITAIVLLRTVALAQPNGGPWQSGLRIAWSSDGRMFGPWRLYQDSSGVPSAVRWKGDTMVCAFQWFREPRTAPTWDRVAVKFSYDAGTTWTEPTPIVIRDFPSNYQRPFDPTLAVVDGQLRIYFSSSDGMPVGGLTSLVNTYSAISSDGVTYTFEPGARYDVADRPVIDPAVIRFRGFWHYCAPRGAPQEGAHHAISNDGLLFTPMPPYPSDAQHNWTGNYFGRPTPTSVSLAVTPPLCAFGRTNGSSSTLVHVKQPPSITQRTITIPSSLQIRSTARSSFAICYPTIILMYTICLVSASPMICHQHQLADTWSSFIGGWPHMC